MYLTDPKTVKQGNHEENTESFVRVIAWVSTVVPWDMSRLAKLRSSASGRRFFRAIASNPLFLYTRLRSRLIKLAGCVCRKAISQATGPILTSHLRAATLDVFQTNEAEMANKSMWQIWLGSDGFLYNTCNVLAPDRANLGARSEQVSCRRIGARSGPGNKQGGSQGQFTEAY